MLVAIPKISVKESDRLISPKQAADILGTSPAFMRGLLATDKIESLTFPGVAGRPLTRIRYGALLKFIAEAEAR